MQRSDRTERDEPLPAADVTVDIETPAPDAPPDEPSDPSASDPNTPPPSTDVDQPAESIRAEDEGGVEPEAVESAASAESADAPPADATPIETETAAAEASTVEPADATVVEATGPEEPQSEDSRADAEVSSALLETAAPDADLVVAEPAPDADAEDTPALAAGSATTVEEAEAEPDAAPAWRSGVIVTAPAMVLTALMTGVFYFFVLVEPSPRWVVLFGSAVAALSMDGVLRASRREAFGAGGLDTTVFLVLPSLYALAAPVFLEHNVRGYWAIPAAGLVSVGFGVLVTGLVSAVRPYDAGRPFGRYVAATATYFVAFALFSLMYTFDVDVRPATVATGLVGALLAAELLRDGEIDQLETLVFAAATGLVIAELRVAMHYLPIDGHLAALTLVLAFYFVAGMLHAHVTRQLDRAAALEYVTIAVTGLVLVAGAQAAGIA